MKYIVNFEPLHKKKRKIVQYKGCQRYRHTERYCNHQFRCVKCSDLRPTKECTKPTDIPPKCVLCWGNHPKNYKGCSAHKVIRRKMYLEFRLKYNPNPNITSPDNEIRSHLRLASSSVPYTRAILGNTSNKRPRDNIDNSQTVNAQTIEILYRLEKLIEKQPEQINNLLAPLMLVINKITKFSTK